MQRGGPRPDDRDEFGGVDGEAAVRDPSARRSAADSGVPPTRPAAAGAGGAARGPGTAPAARPSGCRAAQARSECRLGAELSGGGGSGAQARRGVGAGIGAVLAAGTLRSARHRRRARRRRIAGPSVADRAHRAARCTAFERDRAPSASSEVLSPINRRAAGVAPISAPSSPNTATGSTQAASSRDTRCASERSGPLRSTAAISTAGEPSASVRREHAQVSIRPMRGAKSAQPFEPRAAVGPQRGAMRATSAAAVCVRSNVRTESAAGVGAPNIAAPVGLAHSTRVASGDHSHAGDGRSASGLRRGSCNQASHRPPLRRQGAGMQASLMVSY